MKAILHYFFYKIGYAFLYFILPMTTHIGCAQNESSLRIGIDNDFFAYRKDDGAYTNGLMIDYTTQRKHGSIWKAYQYSLTQIMITPNDIANRTPPPGDYPYSGSILVSYKKSSIDAYRQHSFTTSYAIGILGPYSMAGQTQTAAHKVLHDKLPKGWDSQYGTTVMLNINWSDERGIPNLPRSLAITSKTDISIGTILTGASLQGSIRFGRMNPYFESLTGRDVANRQKRILCYLHASFMAQGVASNTLLTGSISPDEHDHENNVRLKHLVYYSEFGVNFSYVFVGVAMTYKAHSGLIVGQPTKPYGHIAVTVRI